MDRTLGNMSQDNTFFKNVSRPQIQTPKGNQKHSKLYKILLLSIPLVVLLGAVRSGGGALQFPWEKFGKETGEMQGGTRTTQASVLGDTTINPKFSFVVNVPSIFKDGATFNSQATFNEIAT